MLCKIANCSKKFWQHFDIYYEICCLSHKNLDEWLLAITSYVTMVQCAGWLSLLMTQQAWSCMRECSSVAVKLSLTWSPTVTQSVMTTHCITTNVSYQISLFIYLYELSSGTIFMISNLWICRIYLINRHDACEIFALSLLMYMTFKKVNRAMLFWGIGGVLISMIWFDLIRHHLVVGISVDNYCIN